MTIIAADHLLAHWTHSIRPNENFELLTGQLLEAMRDRVASKDEVHILEKLLKNKETDLVYRYLDLQLFYRSHEEPEEAHLSIELEKNLERYFKNAKTSSFKQIVALRSMEKLTSDFLEALGFSRKPPKAALSPGHFGIDMKEMIAASAKDTRSHFLDDFLEHAEESLEYWNRICVQFEQLVLWEETLETLSLEVEMMEQGKSTQETLDIQCSLFERELASFYKEFEKLLTESILNSFSPKTKDALRGRLRKRLRTLNNAYNKKKNELFEESFDLHICCGCDISPNVIGKRVIDTASLKPAASHASSSEKSLLIFTCAGGMGHLNVASSMSQYALGGYHIEVANTLEDTLSSTDLFKRLLFNFSQEKLYNFLLRKEEFEWLKLMTSIGLFFFLMQQESIEKQIRLEVLRRSPDMLISCFPCLNPMFLNIAKELDLPLLMVTTDLDTNLYTKGMNAQTCDLSYPKWKMTLAYDTPETRAVIEKRIPQNKIHVSGFPIRPAFKQAAPDTTKEELRKQFDISPGDRVIVVMIGGIASQTTEKYAHLLSHFTDRDVDSLTNHNLHVICLCGNQRFPCNLEMRLKIDTLMAKSPRVRIHGAGAMEQIDSLMEIADLLITKPGGCSTSEALAKKLPMVFHAPFALMDWEVFNMEFCIRAEMGFRFKFQGSNLEKNKARLLPLIREAFLRKDDPPSYPFEMRDFGEEFLDQLESLLN